MGAAKMGARASGGSAIGTGAMGDLAENGGPFLFSAIFSSSWLLRGNGLEREKAVKILHFSFPIPRMVGRTQACSATIRPMRCHDAARLGAERHPGCSAIAPRATMPNSASEPDLKVAA
jgi:hypothetical protein